MATPQVGKLWTPSGAKEITDDFLEDLYLQAQANGVANPPTQPGTDWYALGVAVGNSGIMHYANQRIAEDNADVLTATGQKLEDKRVALGLPALNPAPASGKIRVRVNGSSTVEDGRQLTLPGGKRIKVVGTWTVFDKTEIDVVALDNGTATNAKAGTVATFVSPPLNVQKNTTVSTSFPLAGGFDVESEPAKRKRILDRLRYQPGGSNWAALRAIAIDAVPSLSGVYVYPALGGPSSAKVVLVKPPNRDLLDFSPVATTAMVNAARAAIQAANASENELIVQAVAATPLDMVLILQLPQSTLLGGNGLGWSDAVPWPQLTTLDSNVVSVTGIAAGASGLTITVSAQTTTPPVDGQTRIGWWSQNDFQFRVFTVVSHTGTAANWTLTLDRPLVDDTGAVVQVGNYISPAAERLADYGSFWFDQIAALGPGENTADVNRLPRALRHPYVAVESPSYPAFDQLKKLKDRFPEIVTAGYGTFSIVPTIAFLPPPSVPASVDLPPNIYQLRNFGIYMFSG